MSKYHPNCVDCGKTNETRGSRCPTCYVKFAKENRVGKSAIRKVLERIRSEEKVDITEALKILEGE